MKYLLAFAPICALLFSAACTQSPQRLIAAGNKYHDKKKYKEASILYQKAIAKDKTNAEAYYREGLNLLDAHDMVAAASFLRRAVDLKPDNSDAESKLAEIYLTAYATNPKRFKSLLPDVQDLTSKILQHNPNSFNGLRLKAILYLTDRNIDKALETFAKANQAKPYSRDLIGWYAQTLLAAQRPADAEALTRDMLNHDKTWGPGYDLLFRIYVGQNNTQKSEAVLRERFHNDPSNPIALQNLANYLVATNRYGEGETIMKRVLDDKKSFPGGRELLGDFYFRNRKFDQALQQYQAGAAEDQKDAVHYQERIVAVDEVMGKRDTAIDLARKLATANPKDATANEIYASLLLQRGTRADIARSLSELKSLVQNNPASAALHVDLARAYFTMNEMDKSLNESLEAIQLEEKARPPRTPVLVTARSIAGRIYEDRGQHAKAAEQSDLVLAVEPKNPDARLIKDRALIATNQADRAQADLEELLQQYPTMNDAHLQLGNLYLNQKKFDKASAQFEAVWKGNPPDDRGLIALQSVKLAQGNGEDAVKTLEDLVQKNPTQLAYKYQLADFEAAVGARAMKADPAHGRQLLAQAAETLKEILKTTANPAVVWLRLGILQRELGQFDAALASFEQAGNADPHYAEAFLNQAVLLASLGKKKEAADAYNKVLGINPENAVALNNLAFLNAESGTNLDQAMTFAERAKKEAPNSPDISDTLGYVYYQKHLNAEALRIFRQAVLDEPQNPTFHFHLAMALLKDGDKQGARSEAEKALKNASQPDEQNKIRSFVNQIG
ncbi:MAG: tetratricopeptide repeat protein [Bryobacteraceae bacterium]